MTLDDLYATILARKDADPSSSWTAQLLAKGPEKCAEKFGEEAIEAIIEAIKDDKAALTSEAADVLYHLLVMLAARDVPLSDVVQELAARQTQSGQFPGNRSLDLWGRAPKICNRASARQLDQAAAHTQSLLEITPVAKPPRRNSPNNR